MADQQDTPGLQFDQAEVKGEGLTGLACANCGGRLEGEYHQINDRTVCRTCRQVLETAFGRGAGFAGFLKALGAGSLAAIAGSVVWYLIATMFNMELGIVAIAIGFGVGFAVRWGTGGRGGWLYQGLAIVLTYFSIVTSYMPVIADGFLENADELELAADQNTPETGGASTASKRTPGDYSQIPLLGWIFIFVLACLAPFLAGFSNIIGWVIIGIALYEAWKINKRPVLLISGPYAVGGAAVAEAPPPG